MALGREFSELIYPHLPVLCSRLQALDMPFSLCTSRMQQILLHLLVHLESHAQAAAC